MSEKDLTRFLQAIRQELRLPRDLQPKGDDPVRLGKWVGDPFALGESGAAFPSAAGLPGEDELEGSSRQDRHDTGRAIVYGQARFLPPGRDGSPRRRIPRPLRQSRSVPGLSQGSASGSF